MAFLMDGKDQRLISNMASTLRARLKYMQSRAYLLDPKMKQLLTLLDEWSKTAGSAKETEKTTDTEWMGVAHGEENTLLSGDALEQQSIETLKVMLQSVRTLTKGSGFPAKVLPLAVSAEVPLTLNADMNLMIRLRIEKALSV